MGQVPKRNENRPYLIVGNGRLATHFRRYFSLLGVEHWHWWRGSDSQFNDHANCSEKIILLISDRAIESFVQKHKRPSMENKSWIHCSGSLSTPLAESAHPLMAFPESLFEDDVYSGIPFITEEGRAEFSKLFPELTNPYFAIPSRVKPLYHAWCVMSGNFTTILWQRFFDILRRKFDLPPDVSHAYLNQICHNLQNSLEPLTGPLVRNDTKTIGKHLDTLKDDPYRPVYEAFLKAYQSQTNSQLEA